MCIIKWANRYLSLLILSFYQNTTVAQKQWSLDECISYAVEHSKSIQRQINQSENAKLTLNSSKNARLPKVVGSSSQDFSFGRGLSSNNSYVNNSISTSSFAVATEIPLFTGFNIPNTIKRNLLNWEASQFDVATEKNSLRLDIIDSYSQVLYNIESTRIAQRQVEIDSIQLARIGSLVKKGKSSVVDLAEQRATLANSILTYTQNQSNLRTSILSLMQLMELPYNSDFSVTPPTDSVESLMVPDPDNIYNCALRCRPEIMADSLRHEASIKGIKIAKSSLYPQLSLSGGIATKYYKTHNATSDPFSTQLKNNCSQSISLDLTIPIFNRFDTRSSIKQAKLTEMDQRIVYEERKKELYNSIQQIYNKAINAKYNYLACIEAVKCGKESFRMVTSKYEKGIATIVDFTESKNKYISSEGKLLQAKYEFLYSNKIMALFTTTY